jgi:hypothetical protein
MRISPGDTLLLKEHWSPLRSSPPFTPIPKWPTALVISIDLGRIAAEGPDGSLIKGRSASVLLLVTGLQIIERDFSWLGRYYTRVEGDAYGQTR